MTKPLVQTAQVSLDPDVIDLGVGQPQASLLPLNLMQRAAERQFALGDPLFLQYGAEQGDGYLRLSLAEFLSQGYDAPVDEANLFITNGASQGLDLICTLYAQAGDTVFIEEPSYFLALSILADHRLRLVPVPTDEHGLIVEALEEKLVHEHPKLLYTIPTFQNPSGYTLSAERRKRLAALSKEHNFLIVADEVYHFLNFTTTPPEPFAAYIGEGNILSLGSFSKILAPGLRLGWIQTDVDRVRQMALCGLLDSGGGLNPFTSALVHHVVDQGWLRQNIDNLCSTFRNRSAAMGDALRRLIPQAQFFQPQGGYFFWVRLPDEIDAKDFQSQAASFKVGLRPGIRFSSQDGFKNYIRLCFAFYETPMLEQGILRLNQALSSKEVL